jgi:simple sugar transport system permease protein
VSFRRFVLSAQGIVLLTAVVLVTGLAALNPLLLSPANLIDLCRNGLITGVFAIGVMLVLASGGIDVSFTAVAAFAMYATVKLLVAGGFDWPFTVILAMSGAIGAVLGLINGLLIGGLRLPTLIVTLGTLSVFRGALLTFLGTSYVVDLPLAITEFSKRNLIVLTNAAGQTASLPVSFLILVGVAAFVSLVMNGTLLGRKIYAIGGSEEGARRIGINIFRVKLYVYILAGAIAGLAGITHVSLARMANPFDIVGSELNVIAAVVLGGARITGGHGRTSGTILGVFIITLINNSLLLIGVPSFWQRGVVGCLILFGTGLPIVAERLRGRLLSRRALAQG